MKRKGELIKVPSPLHTRHWYRIVLDEAHSIKDRYCSTARSAVMLDSTYRWCLSGTPLQNRVGELYSLIRFLRIYPYSYYFCKKCECKSLSWPFRMSDTCMHCEHKSMSHFCWWNRYILNPITKWGYEFEGADAMKTLSKVLRRIMLRRTKVEKAADLKLPPREVLIRWEELDAEENDFYESIYMQSKRKFMSYVEEDTLGTHYANVFELLIRLRQAVDHPYLVVQKGSSTDEKDEICELCSNPFEDPIKV
uniref:Helicase ATP-binding domain-containing protein n=1 Tax=Palpitomonas bilix TaxID=652834 RepID=A0A7S3DIH5_9EUKA